MKNIEARGTKDEKRSLANLCGGRSLANLCGGRSLANASVAGEARGMKDDM
jgi:hypothetical protein